MNQGTLKVSFLCGLFSGVAIILGAVFLLLPNFFRKHSVEKIRDLSHYGRKLDK